MNTAKNPNPIANRSAQSGAARKRVLVTGATGFIGHHCLGLLNARQFEVHAVTSKTVPTDATDSVIWHRANLLNRSEIAGLVSQVQPSHLLHLAWMVVPGESYTSLDNFRWLQSSLDLVEQFRFCGGQRVAVAGSSFEYGQEFGVCSETSTPTRPESIYGVCKHALHEVLAVYCRATGLALVWPRIFFTYGPHEHPNRLVSYVIRSLLLDEPAACSHGRQLRDYLYVEDVADGVVTLLDSDAEGAVNIGLGSSVSLREIVETIGQKIGKSELIRFGAVEPRPNEAPLIVADTTRMTRVSPWRPRYSLDAGLEKTIDWWRSRLGIRKEEGVQCHKSSF